jgi:hypothetical protein
MILSHHAPSLSHSLAEAESYSTLSLENFFLLASKVLRAQELRMSDWVPFLKKKHSRGPLGKSGEAPMLSRVEDNDFCSVSSLCGA